MAMSRQFRMITALPVVLVLLAATGCAGAVLATQAPVRPPMGALFSDVTFPLKVPQGEPIEFPKARYPATAASQTEFFFDPIITGISLSWGNNGLAEVLAKSEVEDPYYAEVNVLNILGIYSKTTVTIYATE